VVPVSAAEPVRAAAAFDLPTVLRFAELALAALGAAREEIDALNVYPVPDGDTGTNMFLTFESARNAMLAALGGETGTGPAADRGPAVDGGDVGLAMAAFTRGALLGARGNSGVIFSQLVGALCKHVGSAPPDRRAAVVLAEGLVQATEASYAAVGQPVEGTILSVARAASDAATRAAAVEAFSLGHVIRAAAGAAREALARTPEQLPVLQRAGVVDAGGRALCVVLDAAETAVTGRRRVSGQVPLGVRAIPMPVPSGDLTPGGP
jgi:dihydroxyacetone kinase-like predicted kinase